MKKLYFGYIFIFLMQFLAFFYTKGYINSYNQGLIQNNTSRNLLLIRSELNQILNYSLLASEFQRDVFLKNAKSSLERIEIYSKNQTDEFKQNFGEIQNQFNNFNQKFSEDKLTKKDIAYFVKEVETLNIFIQKSEKEAWEIFLKQNNNAVVSYAQLNKVINGVMIFSSFLLVFLIMISNKLMQKMKESKQHEKLNTNLVKSLNEAIFVTDRFGKIISCNTSSSMMLGKDARQIVNEQIQDQIPNFEMMSFHKSLSSVKKPLRKMLSSALNINSERIKLFDHNNLEKWYSLSGQPIFTGDTSGDFTYLFSFKDITQNILSQQKIREQEQKILQASNYETIGQMAGGIAHEINNPLFVISGQIDMLNKVSQKKGSLEFDEIDKRTSTISKTIKRIGSIVKGLLALSRRDSMEFQAANLSEITRTTLDFCELIIKKYNVEMKVSWESLNVEFSCIPVQISQVLINLIKNAAQAIEGQSERWIEIKAMVVNKQVKIYIIDSGTGMTSDLKEKILMPYFTTKEVGEGTGLGLNITKSIIEAHHGKLEITTTENNNTQFIVSFPIDNDSIIDDDVNHAA